MKKKQLTLPMPKVSYTDKPRLYGMTRAELKRIFTYCPTTGFLIRKSTKTVQTTLDGHGYYKTRIKKEKRSVARTIYFMCTGKIPDVINHIDGNTTNNKFANLESISHRHNVWLGVTDGLAGLHFDKRTKKWEVRIKEKDKKHYLGLFASYSAAVNCLINYRRTKQHPKK